MSACTEWNARFGGLSRQPSRGSGGLEGELLCAWTAAWPTAIWNTSVDMTDGTVQKISEGPLKRASRFTKFFRLIIFSVCSKNP